MANIIKGVAHAIAEDVHELGDMIRGGTEHVEHKTDETMQRTQERADEMAARTEEKRRDAQEAREGIRGSAADARESAGEKAQSAADTVSERAGEATGTVQSNVDAARERIQATTDEIKDSYNRGKEAGYEGTTEEKKGASHVPLTDMKEMTPETENLLTTSAP